MRAQLIIARLAARQYGVVARGQLLDLGLDRGRIGRAVAAGHLHRLHRGVYAVGHRAVADHGRWMAAALACDGDVGHHSAGALWELPISDNGLTRVIAATAHRRARIDVHRAYLHPRDRTTRHGIPVTTVARTLADLAHSLDDQALHRVVGGAVQRPLRRGARAGDAGAAAVGAAAGLPRRRDSHADRVGGPVPAPLQASRASRRRRRSTARSRGWTSSGTTSASSSRSTAGRPTGPASPSRPGRTQTNLFSSQGTSSCATPGRRRNPAARRSPLRSSPPGTSPAPTPARAAPPVRAPADQDVVAGPQVDRELALDREPLVVLPDQLVDVGERPGAAPVAPAAPERRGIAAVLLAQRVYARSSRRASRAVAASISPSRSIQRGLTPPGGTPPRCAVSAAPVVRVASRRRRPLEVPCQEPLDRAAPVLVLRPVVRHCVPMLGPAMM